MWGVLYSVERGEGKEGLGPQPSNKCLTALPGPRLCSEDHGVQVIKPKAVGCKASILSHMLPSFRPKCCIFQPPDSCPIFSIAILPLVCPYANHSKHIANLLQVFPPSRGEGPCQCSDTQMRIAKESRLHMETPSACP